MGTPDETERAKAASPSDPSWGELGRRASHALVDVRRGERHRVVEGLAAETGTYETRIRKSIAAWAFVDALDDQTMRNKLLAQDLSLVELCAMWAGHDHDGAVAAARRVIAGGYTVRTLMNDEREARSRSSSPSTKQRISRWHAIAEKRLMAGPAAGYQRIPPPRGHQNGPADLWFAGKEKVAAVEVLGPYSAARNYQLAPLGRVISALGYVHLGFESWLVLPIDTAGALIKKHAEELAPGVLRIVELIMPRYEDL